MTEIMATDTGLEQLSWTLSALDRLHDRIIPGYAKLSVWHLLVDDSEQRGIAARF